MFNRNITSNLVRVLIHRYIWKLVLVVLAGILITFISSVIWSASAWADDFFNCFDANECTQALSSSTDCLNPRDYQITTLNVGSDVTVLSFHGGKIEPKTSEISWKLAEMYGWNRYDLYGNGTKECLKGKKNFDKLHITAINFDDPKALSLVKSYPKSIAIHGYNPLRNKLHKYPIGTICVGGKNSGQVKAFIDYVNEHQSMFKLYPLIPVDASSASSVSSTTPGNQKPTCDGLEGTSHQNIVNKNQDSKGLQLELSLAMRHDLANLDDAEFNSLRDVIYGAVAQAMAD